MNRTLFFFTLAFPYGNGESFIENELPYLAESFSKIYIIPLYNYSKSDSSKKRTTPENCIVVNPIITSRIQHYLKSLLYTRTLPAYSREFIDKKIFRKPGALKLLLIDFCTSNNLLQSKDLRNLLTGINNNDILYFYWGKGPVNILPYLSHVKVKKVVRFHHSDLYGMNYNGFVPLQEAILKETSTAVLISENGKIYLREKYKHIRYNDAVSYLGTYNHGVSAKSNDDILRLLSCSFVIPVKRVFLIYKALQSISDHDIEWTHIGGGGDFEELKLLSSKSRSNIKVRLKGQISNQEVLKYYQTNMIDAFINLSSSEGLPVSLMEAISFNVPVIATKVGGTSEIVNSNTGILLAENPSIGEIVNAILNISTLKVQPKHFWEMNFNAEVNYPKFISEILCS